MAYLIEHLEDYLAEQQRERNNPLSVHTLDAYKVDIEQFSQWQAEHGYTLQVLTFENLKEYRAHLESKYSIKSIDRKTATANNLLRHLFEAGVIDLRRQIPRVKHQEQNFLPDMLSNLDYERILRQIRRQNDTQTEAAAMVLYYTGARVSEMLQLKTEDVEKDTVRILGKGAKYRELFFPKILKPYLKKWVEEASKKPGEYLFSLKSKPEPQSRGRLFESLKKYAGAAKVKKSSVSPHALRHLYTKNLSEIGVSPAAIRQLLGHSAKDTTDLYLSMGKKELLGIINKIGTPEDRAAKDKKK